MNIMTLQEQLDRIDTNILSVAGYLNMLSELGAIAIHPRFKGECEQHQNELGKVVVIVDAIRLELGIPAKGRWEATDSTDVT